MHYQKRTLEVFELRMAPLSDLVVQLLLQLFQRALQCSQLVRARLLIFTRLGEQSARLFQLP
jgi:hypothetical protein